MENGGLLFRLEAIEDPVPPGQFSQPDPGTRWIAFDMTAHNPTGESELFSALISAKLVDSQGRELKFAFADREVLDGEIPAGQTRRGSLTYVVPDGTTLSHLEINNDPLGGDPVAFVVSSS